MIKEQIFVSGEKIAEIPSDFIKNRTVITAGMQKNNKIAQYICVNNAQQLDELMSNKPMHALILAPRQLYAKYVFHSGIECLPNFEDLTPYKWDPYSVSQQLLSVAMAAWMGADVIYLFGYPLDDNKELENLRAMITLYPNTEFVHVAKHQTKTNLKNLENFKAMDQPQFKQWMRENG
jgi:hypothetical protein